MYWHVKWRRPEQFDVKISRDGAIGLCFAVAFHKKIGRGPIRVAIEQCSDDAAVQHSRKRLMFGARVPDSNYLVAFGIAIDVQPFLICGPAAEADALGRLVLLERLCDFHASDFTPFAIVKLAENRQLKAVKWICIEFVTGEFAEP